MTKNRKIFWVVIFAVAVFIALLIALPYLGEIAQEQTKTTGGDTPRDLRLADPDLLFAASSWSGLCGNDKGEPGGCFDYFYLYNSGKFIHESKWEGSQNQESNSSEEKQLNKEVMAKIIKQIKDAKILTLNCPALEIMDAGWFYQINSEGTKISFHNPPQACTVEFNKVLDLIEAAPDVK